MEAGPGWEGEAGSDEESGDDGDEEEEDKKPQMELAMMPHYGGINRVRVSVNISVRFSWQRLFPVYSLVTLCPFLTR